jgi:uncharacterized protein
MSFPRPHLAPAGSLAALAAFALFASLIAAALFGAALLAPPVFYIVNLAQDFPFQRTFNRLAMLLFVFGCWLVFRRFGLGGRESLGYGAPKGVFFRQLVVALLIGIALMSLTGALLFAFGLRTLRSESTTLAQAIVSAVPLALLSGLTVALIEETFFRGAMFSAVSRSASQAAAIFSTALLYSASHFLGGETPIASDAAVTWSSGLQFLSHFLSRFAHPLAIADAFIALLLLGVLLALLRSTWGHIAACIGLHGGCVAVIAGLGEVSTATLEGPHAWLVNSADGIVGWLTAAILLLVIVFVLWWTRAMREPPLPTALQQNGCAPIT